MSKLYKGTCHCGAVTFETELEGGLSEAHRCDCSLCRRRGAVAVTAKPNTFKVTAGDDDLRLYQFNTNTAKHYFCGTCGIYTHHFRRSVPAQIGVNLACLEGMTPFLPNVEVSDGQNHQSDVEYSGVVGHLMFEPTTKGDI